jgi:hypothetical protein
MDRNLMTVLSRDFLIFGEACTGKRRAEKENGGYCSRVISGDCRCVVFVFLGRGEVTFFGSLVTNIVTSCVVGVEGREWIRKGNQGVKGFECFWHMSCV